MEGLHRGHGRDSVRETGRRPSLPRSSCERHSPSKQRLDNCAEQTGEAVSPVGMRMVEQGRLGWGSTAALCLQPSLQLLPPLSSPRLPGHCRHSPLHASLTTAIPSSRPCLASPGDCPGLWSQLEGELSSTPSSGSHQTSYAGAQFHSDISHSSHGFSLRFLSGEHWFQTFLL